MPSPPAIANARPEPSSQSSPPTGTGCAWPVLGNDLRMLVIATDAPVLATMLMDVGAVTDTPHSMPEGAVGKVWLTAQTDPSGMLAMSTKVSVGAFRVRGP